MKGGREERVRSSQKRRRNVKIKGVKKSQIRNTNAEKDKV